MLRSESTLWWGCTSAISRIHMKTNVRLSFGLISFQMICWMRNANGDSHHWCHRLHLGLRLGLTGCAPIGAVSTWQHLRANSQQDPPEDASRSENSLPNCSRTPRLGAALETVQEAVDQKFQRLLQKRFKNRFHGSSQLLSFIRERGRN